jgi:putative redox protein
MVEMKGQYLGEKRCEAIHGPSGNTLATDAPKDNNGRGEAFSPTDLVGTALATCILTTLAIVAERDGKDLKGSTFRVTKVMNPNPRKIAELKVYLDLPAQFSPEYRKKLEQIALTCPVHRSLHPDVQMPIEFNWVL